MPGRDGPPYYVIIADDDPFTRLVLRTTLEVRRSLELLEAPDGPEMLRLVEAHHPAIVLLDLNMPGLDGLAVCRQIKSDPALAGTVVIMVTGWSDTATEEAAHAAGADAFMKKPFSPLALLGMLDRLLPNTGPAHQE
ncbi:MAG: two-component system, OmpR family, alkaline phosphatase synthesis response regulator PhoP [Chloroflexota bacterium]|nr:two-component system, OmpR family, alkaline phosphatase synthesis response regulator PhoP [Chloroflexota bacterium]